MSLNRLVFTAHVPLRGVVCPVLCVCPVLSCFHSSHSSRSRVVCYIISLLNFVFTSILWD